QALYLQLDVEECTRSVPGKNIFQAGRAKLIEAGLGNLTAAQRRVVADDIAAVGAEAHVKFKAIAAMSKTEVESFERIFRRMTAGATVSEQQWTRGVQSRSMSRISGRSGSSFAFLNASWNFFSSSSDLCFSAST